MSTIGTTLAGRTRCRAGDLRCGSVPTPLVGGSESIYTPEFVLNGAEWQGGGQAVPAGANQQAGKLTVEVRGSEVVMRYLPERSGGPYAVEIVPLRMNVTSRVTRGENAGRTLTHQFIALSVGWFQWPDIVSD